MKKAILLTAFLLSVGSVLAQGIKVDTIVLAQNFKKHVEILASDSLQGRMINTVGGTKAANYIKNHFIGVGVEPFVEGYLDTVGGAHLKNVVALVKGTDATLANQFIVVGGHYDHVGTTKEGAINRGADDNASGTAVMMELAGFFAENPTKRPMIFVAFDGEEQGLLGSKQFVERWDAKNGEMVAMFNFDMAGNLALANELRIDGVDVIKSADSVAKTIPTIGFNTKIKPHSYTWANMTDTSPFLAEYIPAIYIYTFPKNNIHTPNDSPDLVDYKGMAKIAQFSVDFITSIANRPVIESNYELMDDYKTITSNDMESIQEVQSIFTK